MQGVLKLASDGGEGEWGKLGETALFLMTTMMSLVDVGKAAEREAELNESLPPVESSSDDGQEETRVFFDAQTNELKIDTNKSGPDDTPSVIEAGPLELLHGERLQLRIFVDKSVVEVFANGRQAIARRIYPSRRDSIGVRLFASGGDAQVHSLAAWQIAPANSS